MPLDTENTISRLQSTSARSALISVIVGVLTLIGIVTGKTFDIEAIQTALETWLPLVTTALTTWMSWQAYTGRVRAEKKIEPLPWRSEIAALMHKKPK